MGDFGRIASQGGFLKIMLGVVNKFDMYLSDGADTRILPLGRIKRVGMEREFQFIYQF